jgi:hypothetical protein
MTTPRDSNQIVGRVSRLIQHRKLEEASRALVESALSPQSAEYHVLNCAILNAGGDDELTLAAIEKSRQDFPETWQFDNMQLAVYLRHRDWLAANACIKVLCASNAPELIWASTVCCGPGGF